MKKILALILAGMMLLSLCSCYRAPATQRPNTETETETAEIDDSILTGRIELSGDFAEDTDATAEFIKRSGNDYDIHYQWYIDDAPIAGATTQKVCIPINTAGKKLRLEVFDSFENKVISESKTIAASDSTRHSLSSLLPYVKTYGRTEVINKSLATDWSGSGFDINVQSSGEDMKIAYSGYFANLAIFIDGNLKERKIIRDLVVMDELVINIPAGVHNVKILKDTEIVNAEQAVFSFDSIDFGGEILDKSANGKYLIEFLGGPVTCGNGVLGSFSTFGWNQKDHSFINSYAYKLCQKLGADWSVLAKQNLGLVAKDGSYCATDIYKYTDRYRSKNKSNPDKKPDIVVIELGENDNAGTGVKEDTFYTSLGTLITAIRSYCGDNVKIVFMSPTKTHYDSMMKYISNSKKPGGLFAWYVADGYGTGGGNPEGSHICMPNAQEQSKLASDLLAFLQTECKVS